MQKVQSGQFEVAQVDGKELGVIAQSFSEPGWASCTVRLLRTFSWDAKSAHSKSSTSSSKHAPN